MRACADVGRRQIVNWARLGCEWRTGATGQPHAPQASVPAGWIRYRAAIAQAGGTIGFTVPRADGRRLRVKLRRGCITETPCRAVVSPSNAHMCGNANAGGWWFRHAQRDKVLTNADGAIRRAAGPGLASECDALPNIGGSDVKLRVGTARTTSGHGLDADHVIHTLGPGSHAGKGSVDELRRTFAACYAQADRLCAGSLALPAVSCGVFAFPPAIGATGALESVATYAAGWAGGSGDADPDGALERIEFALYDEAVFNAFADAAQLRWGAKS